MEYQFKFVSSLEKVFFKNMEQLPEHNQGSMLKNEIYSFQLVGWCGPAEQQKTLCYYQIHSELLPYLTVKAVGYIPNLVPTIEMNDDEDYLTKTPGLFPDPLLDTVENGFELAVMQTRALWISVEPAGNIFGTFPITIELFDREHKKIAELTHTVKIINAQLPELPIVNTGWFHGDCIAKLHHVEMMSEEYFAITEKFLEVYTHFGHNAILTPIVTPPLDTAVGKERLTNQLVDISVEQGRYHFGFQKLERWINMCQKHGIRYFEMAHLFTQWGAEHAPKIMAWVDGTYQRIFGWETDAKSEEYRGFLSELLPALVTFLKNAGVFERCFFHVSDEPIAAHQAYYGANKELLCRFVPEEQMIDALSEYSFYEKGLIKCPVVCNDHIHHFQEHGVTPLWTYYCMAQRKNVANRFLAMPSYRSRILGAQLYKNQINGFLQWGFNFWFAAGSQKTINPYEDPTSDGNFPGGDPFLVYPLNENGEVGLSIRLYVFNEAMQDLRALTLLEQLSSREQVLKLLEDVVGMDQYPRNRDYLLNLRETINHQIETCLA